MGYIFGNQYGVMTVNDERTVGQPKEIRFINSGYDLLFKIPDGGYVEIKFGDGRIKAYQCRFLDPLPFLHGGRSRVAYLRVCRDDGAHRSQVL